MDSGSTVLAVLLAGTVLAFLGLHGADAALPLLRRSHVRDTLGDRGLREAAIRRLRASRAVYEELIWFLTLMSMASAASVTLGLMVAGGDLPWWFMVVVLAGAWVLLLSLVPLVEGVVKRLSVSALVKFGTLIQFALWPLLPLGRFSAVGLRLGNGDSDAPGTNGSGGGTDAAEPTIQVEEEIAEEPLERHERAMIHAILHLDETPVREIMVPRVDVVSLDIETAVEKAVPRFLESGHSRLPVYEENPDNVIGILYSRDLLGVTARGDGADAPDLRDLLRPCFFVPESKRVDEMLSEFQTRRVHLAVVIDEYGGVAGIVTIEDLLEEIVGEIEDEFDLDEPEIEWRPEGDAIVDARMSIDKFGEAFGATVSPEGFDTLGGLMFSRLGRIPTAGDTVAEGDLQMQVITTVGRRIKKVRVHRREATVDAQPSPDQTPDGA
ncbi:MAG: hemolysin family protein [Dehalococcoidia bacterium]